MSEEASLTAEIIRERSDLGKERRNHAEMLAITHYIRLCFIMIRGKKQEKETEKDKSYREELDMWITVEGLL